MCCEGLAMMLYEAETPMGSPNNQNAERRPTPLTGKTVMALIVAAFAVVFLANGALIYTALSTLHGEELENPYDASQAYNARLAEARAQDARGWSVDVTTRQEEEGVRVVADFRDRSGAAIPDLRVVARFQHPIDKSADREMTLTSDGGGYEGVVPPLHAGKWTLILEAQQNGRQVFRSENKLSLSEASVEN